MPSSLPPGGGSLNTDTDYATVEELRVRVSLGNSDSTDDDPTLQAILNAAAYVVDQVTRMPLAGQAAFSETANTTRYFDDSFSGVIAVDDATDITLVKRNGTTLLTSEYTLAPYNAAPFVAIILDAGGSGARAIQVNAKWGYCAVGNRPAVVKEATLVQAERMYEKIGLAPMEQLQAQVIENPFAWIDGFVLMMLLPLQRPEAAKIYKQRRVIVKQAS